MLTLVHTWFTIHGSVSAMIVFVSVMRQMINDRTSISGLCFGIITCNFGQDFVLAGSSAGLSLFLSLLQIFVVFFFSYLGKRIPSG